MRQKLRGVDDDKSLVHCNNSVGADARWSVCLAGAGVGVGNRKSTAVQSTRRSCEAQFSRSVSRRWPVMGYGRGKRASRPVLRMKISLTRIGGVADCSSGLKSVIFVKYLFIFYFYSANFL